MPILGARIPVAAIVGRRIAWDFRHNFSVADADPLTDPLPADNVGTLDVLAGTGLDVAGGWLEFNSATGANDPRIYTTDSWARAAGRAFFWRAQITTGADSAILVGIDDSQAAIPTNNAFFFRTGIDFRLQVNDTSIGGAISLTADTTYDIAIVCRDTGAFYYIKGGTEYPTWTLLFVDDVTATTPVYWGGAANDAGVAQSIRIATGRSTMLGGAYGADFGLATQRLAGARSAGDTFTHAADAIIEFTATTLPSAGQIEMWFRIQDATNYWMVTVDSTGALDLDEVVAGVPTERGTAAGVITGGERIQIHANGSTIRVYDSTAERIEYASASNFATETDGELDTEATGGAVDDIVSWPLSANFDRYLAGA